VVTNLPGLEGNWAVVEDYTITPFFPAMSLEEDVVLSFPAMSLEEDVALSFPAMSLEEDVALSSQQ
jgi:hypothetical protein